MSSSVTLNLSKQQGMTLLEVLVATAILAIISGLAFLSLDNLVKSKASLDAKTEELNQLNLAQFMFQNDLQMAISSQQTQVISEQQDFIGNSQIMTFLRYNNPQVANGRETRLSNALPKPMIRVKWMIRNQQWVRATQNALSPLNSNQWQEQVMLELDSLNCSYQSRSGLMQTTWPNTRFENSQLPESIHCQIQSKNEQRSVLKIVPWQNARGL
ncbi:MAG: hypothetical protein DHS20C09_18990 [marine bacterium B5-7]|nr:MAG: hypothetical protein DHS20C09_18990 [marine bacterium B5-7]